MKGNLILIIIMNLVVKFVKNMFIASLKLGGIVFSCLYKHWWPMP